jgi:hypothetical protein
MKKTNLYRIITIATLIIGLNSSIYAFADEIDNVDIQQKLESNTLDNNLENGIMPYSIPDKIETNKIAEKKIKLSNGRTIGIRIRYDLYKNGNTKYINDIKDVKPYANWNVGINKASIDDWWVDSMSKNKQTAKIRIMGDYKYSYDGYTKTDEFDDIITLEAGE